MSELIVWMQKNDRNIILSCSKLNSFTCSSWNRMRINVVYNLVWEGKWKPASVSVLEGFLVPYGCGSHRLLCCFIIKYLSACGVSSERLVSLRWMACLCSTDYSKQQCVAPSSLLHNKAPKLNYKLKYKLTQVNIIFNVYFT